MFPFAITTALSFRRRLGSIRIAVEPLLDHIVIELFRPQHPGERLAHHRASVVREMSGGHCLVELVSFVNSLAEDLFEIRERVLALPYWLVRQTQTNCRCVAGRDC